MAPCGIQSQQKKLIDSVLRGYPIPLIYLHLIKQSAGKLRSERYEVIDGQQRINAFSDFFEGAFRLFDPVKDAAEARFPEFIKNLPCPWGGANFQELSDVLKSKFLKTPLRIIEIETEDANEARDLFVRLQAGMPLNSQEKRDAWPGQFTDFVLSLGGKFGIARYPGHDFFNVLMRGKKLQDRGKLRQLAAQITMLYLTRKKINGVAFCDINSSAIDDFYYENLGFDAESSVANRLFTIFDRIAHLLGDQKRSKLVGHEAIHLVLLVDQLLDDYTPAWQDRFALAFDDFRKEFLAAKREKDDSSSDYWLRYGVNTRVNSDRGEAIQRRHEFFASRMLEKLEPTLKDPQRQLGAVERELVYYRDKKLCAVCKGEVRWPELDVHHIDEHAKGGRTSVENSALVHRECHPKGHAAVAFASAWRMRIKQAEDTSALISEINEALEADDGEESS